jgi:hypothetical protein
MKAKRVGNNRWRIDCPGCGEAHVLDGRWSFNGDQQRPTFSPSLLLRTGHYASAHTDNCWCTYNAENPGEPAPFSCNVCHSFIRDGHIEFLGDSTHKLAGQRVVLPDVGLGGV